MKLSVIIPVYNVEKYLSKCLDSVIHPELEDYEIIAVNDGSTDSSPAILEEYRARYGELIRVIHKENGGLGSARNAGTAAARGDYILYLDSDDYLLPEAVEELIAYCTGEYDICFFDFESVDENGNSLGYMKGADFEGSFSLKSKPSLLLSPPNAWNKLVRRSLYENTKLSFPPRAWYEDIRTMPKLYLHAPRCCHISKPYYRYLMREGSIMNNRSSHRNLEIIDALCDLCAYYREQGQYERYENELEYLAFYHWYICAGVRVCLADSKGPDAGKLRDSFISTFPNYRNNLYVRSAPAKYKLLDRLISQRLFGLVSFIMGLNAKLK